MAKNNNDKMNLHMDYAIKSNKVRVVDPDGTTTVMYRDDAIEKAKEQHKNLVQIAFNPSVYPGSICKIIDYAKFKYDEKKRQKEQQKKIRASKADLKEIKFTIRVDDHDRDIKIEHAKEFLNSNNDVKITITMSKREMSRLDYAKTLMKSILSCFDGIARLDGTPSLDGRNLSCILKRA